jgi:hypothetical protein
MKIRVNGAACGNRGRAAAAPRGPKELRQEIEQRFKTMKHAAAHNA